MTEGKIVSWVKSPGDKVEKGETVVIVESDKADMDVESFYEGYLATIITPAGDVAEVGSAIALLAETEDEIETAQQQAADNGQAETTASTPASTITEAPAEPAVSSASQTAATETQVEAQESAPQNGAGSSGSTATGRLIVSPRARKLAKELKVDLESLAGQGSGPHGRIVAQDVEAAAGKEKEESAAATTAKAPAQTAAPSATKQPPTVPTPAPAAAAPPPQAATPGEVVPFNTLQQAVVRNMNASLQVPTFHVGYTITTDALDTLYQTIKSKGVTMTALLAKAVSIALKKHPLLNASYTDQGVQNHGDINIAIAVAMAEGGLITPVLRNADQIDIYSLSRTWKDLVARSRSKQLQPEEYNSGTFTLSNLGMFGVDRFDAILPPGQGSILAIGASRPQLVATAEGMMAVQRQMQVNITCDHRIIYGADAAAFLQDLAKIIETDTHSLTL
jgi:pyruvate dehydrogenase E2 component (dihydrolipoamide acetyltransferase)